MKKRLSLIGFLSFLLSFANGQSKTFSLKDTLVGSITPARSWWNVVMYDLEIEPDLIHKTISGKNRISFQISNKPVSTLQIDLQQPMKIDSVFLLQTPLSFERIENAYFLKVPDSLLYQLTSSYQKNENTSYLLEIFFHGIPIQAKNAPWDGGIVWQHDEHQNPWVGVACQGIGASSWWPCKDHPYDEPDSAAISVIVPDSLMNISNGRLRKKEKISGDKTKWQWFVSSPINSYNLTFNIGKYGHLHDTLHGENGILDLDYYVLDYNLPKALKHFQQIKPMLRAFEYWMGPYPFYEDGYKIIETSYLGMEHQSAIAYGNNYQKGYMGRDLSYSGWGENWDYLLIHESGHEWFGNQVSCNDVADLWIHEGFTTYTETFYVDYTYGKKAADEYVKGLRLNIENKEPIIGKYGVRNEGSGDMYFKGANIIHMIRALMQNDSLFREMIRTIQKKYRLQQISSDTLEAFLSQYSGISLSTMFETYLRDTRIPILKYKYRNTTDGIVVKYRWENCNSNFNMPILLPVQAGMLNKTIPTTKWQEMKTKFTSIQAFQKMLDPNFYVQYERE